MEKSEGKEAGEEKNVKEAKEDDDAKQKKKENEVGKEKNLKDAKEDDGIKIGKVEDYDNEVSKKNVQAAEKRNECKDEKKQTQRENLLKEPEIEKFDTGEPQ